MVRPLLAILALAALGGCGSAPSNGDAKPLSADAQIKAIEDNPHMPAEAKAAATARLRQSQGQGQAQKPTAGG